MAKTICVESMADLRRPEKLPTKVASARQATRNAHKQLFSSCITCEFHPTVKRLLAAFSGNACATLWNL
jgi:hypothetical protein